MANNLLKLGFILVLILVVIGAIFLLGNFLLSNSINQTNYTYSGVVSGQDLSVLSDVKVTGFAGETNNTDSSGKYSFSSSFLGKGIITFEKEGFVPLHKPVVFGKENLFIDVLMFEETPFQKVDPSKEINAEMNGASLSVEANSFVIKDSEEKASSANISLTPFDPAKSDEVLAFPGNFEGINEDGLLVEFISFSFMKIQVEDDAGEKLDLADGKMAEVIFPIGKSLEDSAPNVIPLWYFDPVKGTWIERGEATKICENESCNYIGKIDTIASWWNCDEIIVDNNNFVDYKLNMVMQGGTSSNKSFTTYVNKDSSRMDVETEEGEGRFISSPKGTFSCSFDAELREWTCIDFTNMGGENSAVPFTNNSPLVQTFNNFSNLGNELLQPVAPRVIAGETTICYKERISEEQAEFCLNNRGILFYFETQEQGEKVVMIATEYFEGPINPEMFEPPAQPTSLPNMPQLPEDYEEMMQNQ